MGKDSSEIRREIEHTRARMGDTVEAISYKADVPARVKDAVNDRVASVKGTIGEVVDSVKETVNSAQGRAGKALGSTRRSAESSWNVGSERMSDTIGQVRERVRGAAGDVRGRMGETMGTVRERMPDAEDVRGMVRRAGIAVENPLGLALGALAVGFLAGLLIPVTDYEREKIGPLRDDLLERAQTVRGEVVEHGRAVLVETGQATLEAAKRAAQQHGREVIAGDLDRDTLMTNAIEHGKQALRETAQVAMETARASVEEHGKYVAEAAGAARVDDLEPGSPGTAAP